MDLKEVNTIELLAGMRHSQFTNRSSELLIQFLNWKCHISDCRSTQIERDFWSNRASYTTTSLFIFDSYYSNHINEQIYFIFRTWKHPCHFSSNNSVSRCSDWLSIQLYWSQLLHGFMEISHFIYICTLQYTEQTENNKYYAFTYWWILI